MFVTTTVSIAPLQDSTNGMYLAVGSKDQGRHCKRMERHVAPFIRST